MRKQRLIVALGLVISALFLFLAFRELKPAEVLDSIRAADPFLIALAAVWYFAAVAVISKRWGYLLRGAKPLSVRDLFPLVSIGYMGNNVYPLRTGEVLRLLLLQRRHGIPVARAAVAVVIERMFDGLVMLTFIFTALAVLNVNSDTVTSIARVTAPLFLVALVVFFALAFRPAVLRTLAHGVARLLPGRLSALVLRVADDVTNGLASLRSPRELIGAVVFSYLSWLIEASVYWLVSLAFSLDVSYITILLVVGVVNLAGLIPASPGQFGVFEFFVIAALGLVGIDEGRALAYGLTIHLTIWLPVTVVGFLFLARAGLGWNAMAIARAQALTASAEPETAGPGSDAPVRRPDDPRLEERAAFN
jgi:hypothetical protein